MKNIHDKKYVADHFGVSVRTIDRWINLQYIQPSAAAGQSLRFTDSDIFAAEKKMAAIKLSKRGASYAGSQQ